MTLPRASDAIILSVLGSIASFKLADFGIGGVVAQRAILGSRIGTVGTRHLRPSEQASLFCGSGTPLYMLCPGMHLVELTGPMFRTARVSFQVPQEGDSRVDLYWEGNTLCASVTSLHSVGG